MFFTTNSCFSEIKVGFIIDKSPYQKRWPTGVAFNVSLDTARLDRVVCQPRTLSVSVKKTLLRRRGPGEQFMLANENTYSKRTHSLCVCEKSRSSAEEGLWRNELRTHRIRAWRAVYVGPDINNELKRKRTRNKNTNEEDK